MSTPLPRGLPLLNNSSDSGIGDASTPAPRHIFVMPELIDLNKLTQDPSKRKQVADYHPSQRDEMRKRI